MKGIEPSYAAWEAKLQAILRTGVPHPKSDETAQSAEFCICVGTCVSSCVQAAGRSMSNPWLKFYPSDWRADPALRVCSIGARGLWMEMLCLMHDSQARGSLMGNGRPGTPRQLAPRAGCSIDEVQTARTELEEAGVFSRELAATIYSRRMRRDDDKARRDKANGSVGGNPSLKGVNPPDNPGVKAQIPETRSQIDGGGDARARPRSPSMIGDEANRLFAEILEICAIDRQFVPPGWCGAPMRIQTWINQGWTGDVILIAVRKAMGRKRGGAPDSVAYFERAIAREVAEQAAPVPTATVIPLTPETIHAKPTHGGGSRLLQARDRILEQINGPADDGGSPADDACSEPRHGHARLLPKG